MSRLSLSLLGPFQATLDGEPVTGLSTDKERALLAYLAVEADRPHRRDALAGLLWPDHPQRKARHSLRQALFNLRQALGDQDEAFLNVTRETVQFYSQSDRWLDVATFAALVGDCQSHRHRRLQACRPCLRRLEEAAKLYQGAFLESLALGNDTAFEEWALLKREWLHRMAVETLLHLAGYYERRGEYERARHYAGRQVKLEPWNEEAHQRLMRLLALAGQRGAALAQYEICRRALVEELGVAPTPGTIALYEFIRAGGLASAPILHNLPPPPSPLVGREEELGELDELLADPDRRLLSLVGPGGIGKTHLALQAAQEQVGAFADGVYFVPLAAVGSAEFLLPTLADALDFSFQGQQDPQEQLLSYLRQKELLLVLDNLEHLLQGCDLLVEVLRRAPGVVLLVTSRERLNLQEEWVYEIRGLTYPENGTARGLEAYSAVELFRQSARRARQDFELAEQEAPYVTRICQLVEGMPLGIELAAAGVATNSLAQITQEIEHNLDVLTTATPGVSERHRSVRATFEHSWRLLSEQEQRVFAQLAVFRGGFERNAVEQVTGASMLVLAMLVHKSLLRCDATGRYQVHQLLRQYAAEKLATQPPAQATAHERHCTYYTRFAQRQEASLAGADPPGALAAMRTELENVRAAWRWAVTHSRLPEIERSLSGLSRFYLLRGPFQEGEALIKAGVNSLWTYIDEAGTAQQDAQITLTRLLVEQARLLNAQALYDQAIEAAQMAVDLAQLTRRQDLEAHSLMLWGRALRLRGNYEAAQTQLDKALSLARSNLLRQTEADSLNALGAVYVQKGDLSTAQRHFDQALRIYQEISDRWGESAALNSLGVAHYYQGHYAGAITCQEQALDIYRELGDRWGEAKLLNNLGNNYADQGYYTEAGGYYEQAMQIHRQIGNRRGESIVLNNLAALYWSQGDCAQARSCYDQALHICREIGDRQGEGLALSNLSLVSHLCGDDEAALDYGQRALLIAQELGDRPNQAGTLTRLGHAQAGLGRWAESTAAYEQALALRRKLGLFHLAMETLAGLARVSLAQGDLDAAQSQVEEILSYLETSVLAAGSSHGLDGTDEPFRIYLTCYHVLHANQDPRAKIVLETAQRLLQEQAAKISDARLRRSFLERVAVHREIVAALACLDHESRE